MNSAGYNYFEAAAAKADRKSWSDLRTTVINTFKKRNPDHQMFKTGSTPKSFELRDCTVTTINGSIIAILPK